MSIRDIYLCCRNHEEKTYVGALRINRIDSDGDNITAFCMTHASCDLFIGDEETEYAIYQDNS